MDRFNIFLTPLEAVDGEKIGTVDEEAINEIKRLSKQRNALMKQQEKITLDKDKRVRYSQKFIEHLAVSRNIVYDYRIQGLGIYNGETIYITSIENLKKNPTGEPTSVDVIKGTMTKSEKRKYQEIISGNDYFNNKLESFKQGVLENEQLLENFEKMIIDNSGLELDPAKHSLIISTKTLSVYLIELSDEDLGYEEHRTD
jgi:hypothetical protein